MAQTNSNKRAETELVLAASIQRLLDKTVRAPGPPIQPSRVSHDVGREGLLSYKRDKRPRLGLHCLLTRYCPSPSA